MEIPSFLSQLWSTQTHCQSLSRQMTKDHHFPLLRGVGGCGCPEGRRKNRKRGSSFNQEKAPRLDLGIPLLVWLVVFSVGEPDSWDVPMSYFLLSFALGSGILFPSHVGCDTAAARVSAVRRLAEWDGRQLSFNWRSQVQVLVLANIHYAAESLRMTLNPLLLTLHIDLFVKSGKN